MLIIEERVVMSKNAPIILGTYLPTYGFTALTLFFLSDLKKQKIEYQNIWNYGQYFMTINKFEECATE